MDDLSTSNHIQRVCIVVTIAERCSTRYQHEYTTQIYLVLLGQPIRSSPASIAMRNISTYKLYQDHMLYQYIKNENQIVCKCSKCGLTISTFGNLERHMNDFRCREVHADFEFDGLMSELRSRANFKHVKNYVYLISDGNEFFKNGQKLEDYV